MALSERKKIPDFVHWDQRAILNASSRLASGIVGFVNSTITPVATDSRALSVRDVDTSLVVSALEDNTAVLHRIEHQLGFLLAEAELGDYDDHS